MREYFEARRKGLLDQISNRDPKVERRLKQIFGEALNSAFEDMEENGVQPDNEERFWKNLSQMLLENGCFRYGYRYFQNMVDTLYLEMENQFQHWPPQETMNWQDHANYVQVQRLDEWNDNKYFTLIFPAEPKGLQAFLQKNRLHIPQECYTLYVSIVDENSGRLGGLEMLLYECKDYMALNYFFYRYCQLTEKEKNIFGHTLDAKHIDNVKDLINLTANIDGICILENIQSKEELGKFLVEEDLTFLHFEDRMLPYLDYKKVAEMHMQQTGGRLCWGTYIEDTTVPEEWVEIYDGVHLPDFTLAQEEHQETQEINGGMAL